MPSDTHLVAISVRTGNYSVVSNFNGSILTDKLEKSGRLFDVSNQAGHRDFAAILSREQCMEYLVQGSSSADWFSNLPDDVCFVLVHFEEWESGLGD